MSKASSALIDLLERQEGALNRAMKRSRASRIELFVLSLVVILFSAGSFMFHAYSGQLVVASFAVMARMAYVAGTSATLNRSIKDISKMLGPIRVLLEDTHLATADAEKIQDQLSSISHAFERHRPLK